MSKRRLSVKPSVIEVAKLAGVSTATVSRVLNRFPGIQERTKQKVAKALRDLKYSPEGLTSKTVTIFIESDTGLKLNAYSSCLLSELTLACGRAGLGYEIWPISQVEEARLRATKIAIGICWTEKSLQTLRAQPFELTILINEKRPKTISICTDHVAQGRMAAQTLIDLGHQKLGILFDSRTGYGSSSRLLGWNQTLEENKNRISKNAIAYVDGNLEECLTHLKKSALTALLITGEDLALPALATLQKLQWKIPDELSVISFENPWISQWLTPPPTTIEQDIPALAREVVMTAQNFIDGQSVKSRLDLPSRLILRESTKAYQP